MAETLFLSNIVGQIDETEKEALKLDLVALIFTVFMEIEKRENISRECFVRARDVLCDLNSELCSQVEEKRFSPVIAIKYHDVCNMTVAQSQKMINEHLMDKLVSTYILPLEAELEKITDMKLYLANFSRKFAAEMAPEIISTWRSINIAIQHTPENEKINSMRISFCGT